MPSVRYYNQTAPFWDFIASLEGQGLNNNNNSNDNNNNRGESSETEGERPNPWSEGWAGFPWGPVPHRGGRRGPPHHHDGPPPPPPEGEHDNEAGPSEPRDPPPPFSDEENEGPQHGRGFGRRGHGPHRGFGAQGSGDEKEGHPHGRRHGPHGHGPRGFGAQGSGDEKEGRPHGRRHGPHGHGPRGFGAQGSDEEGEGYQHGRWHGKGGHGPPRGLGAQGSDDEKDGFHGRHGRHGHGPHRGPGGRGGPFGARGRGGWGGRGRGHFHPYAIGPLGAFAEMFQSQLFGEDGASKDKQNEDFKPEVDVFDTEDAFVVHVSLPGAKKEDVGVHWDAEKSELALAGVIHRPGDEELLKTLALDERKVGAFERKVRLGSRANPAQVDVEGITARMEDGILRVEVPKLDADIVEIKKVDIE